ncbi:hypothetical protein F5Y16DRAFT_362867 [Xylariaceae sp. FL0255]|nr:hypothetical protein F5Y16DRAFT_362867 [Xylariaceae sp. FL0255]
MPGWSKIEDCCRQALRDNLSYAWVDTCCIDKDSFLIRLSNTTCPREPELASGI